jgi:hypothetical protein
MPEARHRADHRSAARKGLLGALVSPFVLAALVIGGLVSVTAVAQTKSPEQAAAASGPAAVVTLDAQELAQLRDARAERVSRAGGRPAPVAKPVTLKAPKVVDQEFATEPLNIWRGPGEQGPKIGVLDAGSKVAVTSTVVRGWKQIVLTNPEKGKVARWVNADFLAENKPKPEPEPEEEAETSPESAPATQGQCTNGTSVPAGVSPNITAVHQAVCAAFPEITTYGTFRSDGEHGQGLAVDIMVSGDRGWQVAEFIRNNYSQLGVNYLIYSQQIWSVDRSGEGWRGMEDRGSTTANHYDHVHVTTY